MLARHRNISKGWVYLLLCLRSHCHTLSTEFVHLLCITPCYWTSDVVLYFMELTCWWRIRKCQNNRNKYNQSEKCNGYHVCVLQVQPLLWSMTVSPISEEQKAGVLSQCWFCEKTAYVDTHTAPFPLQATLTSSACLFTKVPWETQGRRLWKPSFCSRRWLGLWAMPSFSPAASLQSCLATSRDLHTRFSPTWPCPIFCFFCPLGFPTQWLLFFWGSPCPALGVSLCITSRGWLAAPPCAPPASWAPTRPSLSPPGGRGGWCSEEGPPGSLVLPVAPAGCSVS